MIFTDPKANKEIDAAAEANAEADDWVVSPPVLNQAAQRVDQRKLHAQQAKIDRQLRDAGVKH